MRYSFPKLVEILASGGGLVLATVIETEDSTPQVPGASAVFSAGGLVAGTVGGGLLEAKAQTIAGEALRDRRCRLALFRLDADPGDKEGALCGGTAVLLIDPLVDERKGLFWDAHEALRAGMPGVLASLVVPVEGDEVDIRREWLPGGDIPGNSPLLEAGLTIATARAVLASGQVRLRKLDQGFIFLEPVRPSPRLIIAGAGHVGRALSHLGSLLDFEVIVIDDRAEFANRENVPDADRLIVGDVAAAVQAIPGSPDDYFVVVTRGHELDAEALRACLGHEAAYIGMIGSKNKVATMRREFLEMGWTTEDRWARIHTPIGLEIGSKTVEEIVVSIAAQLVLVRSTRKKEGRP